MTFFIGYPPAPLQMPQPVEVRNAASQTWVRRIAEIVNQILTGKQNVARQTTLLANSATTTVIDARISAESALLFSPLTANAAAAMGGLYVSARQSGQATLTHANNAQTDRQYVMVIIG